MRARKRQSANCLKISSVPSWPLWKLAPGTGNTAQYSVVRGQDSKSPLRPGTCHGHRVHRMFISPVCTEAPGPRQASESPGGGGLYQNGQPGPAFLSSRSGPQTLGEYPLLKGLSCEDQQVLLVLRVQGPHCENSRPFRRVWGCAD